MMEQPTLWTSREAAESIKDDKLRLIESVYRCIEHCGPLTDEAIAEMTGLNPNTARPRRIELVAEGRVQASLRLGRTKSGRSAVQWEAVGS